MRLGHMADIVPCCMLLLVGLYFKLGCLKYCLYCRFLIYHDVLCSDYVLVLTRQQDVRSLLCAVLVLAIWGPLCRIFQVPPAFAYLRFLTSPCSLNRSTTFLVNYGNDTFWGRYEYDIIFIVNLYTVCIGNHMI